MKYRAVIIGAGRMGVGGPGWNFPYVYTHADTYKALGDRVTLVGTVDPVKPATWRTVEEALDHGKPDIVSICTPNGTHVDVLSKLKGSKVKGIWLEKPCELTAVPEIPVQVNYCRRFCGMHWAVRQCVSNWERHLEFFKLYRRPPKWAGEFKPSLYVWARKDWTTIVHFADLARWFGIPKERITYVDNTGEYPSTNSYRIDVGKWSFDFRNGGVEGEFMENALSNLIDAVDGKAQLISPVSEAIESEKLAREMLNGSQ